MPKNYYIILGIPSDSTQADIKAAYRRLAKEFHPDHYSESPAPFQCIQEAYSVLGDPKSRKSYDSSLQSSVRVRQTRGAEPMRQYSEREVEPLVDERRLRSTKVTSVNRSIHHQWGAFDDIFDRFLGEFTEHLQPGQGRRREDITIQVVLSPEQARSGGNVRIMVPIEMPCPSCFRSNISRYYTCWRCSGAGILRGDKQLLLSYPPGITEGHSLQVSLDRPTQKPLHLRVVFTVR